MLAYGVTASSKQCGQAIEASFKKYPSAQVVFTDYNLQFAQADLSADVSQMKQKGAQFIMTCIDQKESLVLAKEIAKQHLNAVQNLPNAYDPTSSRTTRSTSRARSSSRSSGRSRRRRSSPSTTLLLEWMQKSGKTRSTSSSIEGWIAANEFVHGLKLAGPDFTPGRS